MANEQVEWCLLCAFIGPGVVGELCKCQQVHPVILFIITIDPQILLHALIRPFRLPIRLGMVRGTEVLTNVEHAAQFFHKLGGCYDYWTL